jgi:hypothetical protein
MIRIKGLEQEIGKRKRTGKGEKMEEFFELKTKGMSVYQVLEFKHNK